MSFSKINFTSPSPAPQQAELRRDLLQPIPIALSRISQAPPKSPQSFLLTAEMLDLSPVAPGLSPELDRISSPATPSCSPEVAPGFPPVLDRLLSPAAPSWSPGSDDQNVDAASSPWIAKAIAAARQVQFQKKRLSDSKKSGYKRGIKTGETVDLIIAAVNGETKRVEELVSQEPISINFSSIPE